MNPFEHQVQPLLNYQDYRTSSITSIYRPRPRRSTYHDDRLAAQEALADIHQHQAELSVRDKALNRLNHLDSSAQDNNNLRNQTFEQLYPPRSYSQRQPSGYSRNRSHRLLPRAPPRSQSHRTLQGSSRIGYNRNPQGSETQLFQDPDPEPFHYENFDGEYHHDEDNYDEEHHNEDHHNEEGQQDNPANMQAGVKRSTSLSQRFPGDNSHRPLDQIRRETKKANRSHHLRKGSIPATDEVDQLGTVLGPAFHHDGPYDATLAARNRDKRYAPVEAVKSTNAEALKATPRENVQDSLQKHVPLQGTAVIPPGMTDMSGRRMSYEEGADLQREWNAGGGAYKRYADIVSCLALPGRAIANADLTCQDYHPHDLKGKGEPSYTLERNEQEKKQRRRSGQNGAGVYEMLPTSSTPRSRPGLKDDNVVRQRSFSSGAQGAAGPSNATAVDPFDDENQGVTNDSSSIRRNHTTGKKLTEGLKKRFVSLRRKDH